FPLEPTEAVFDIRGVADSADFPVVHHIDTGVELFADDFGHCCPGTGRKGRLILQLALLFRIQHGQQIIWTGQAASMSCQDSLRLLFHGSHLPLGLVLLLTRYPKGLAHGTPDRRERIPLGCRCIKHSFMTDSARWACVQVCPPDRPACTGMANGVWVAPDDR